MNRGWPFNGGAISHISYIQDFKKWPMNRGWPLYRWPLNGGLTVWIIIEYLFDVKAVYLYDGLPP